MFQINIFTAHQKIMLLACCLIMTIIQANAQHVIIPGTVMDNQGNAIEDALIVISNHNTFTQSDEQGRFQLDHIAVGAIELQVSKPGFEPFSTQIVVQEADNLPLQIILNASGMAIEEVVVTGTLKAMRKSESPVPVSILSSQLFRQNGAFNVFDALYMVNGINPQMNCNLCNTSDIGINGMPGPYTLVLIDGMPVVSALSTVYGFSGIPNNIIDRVEIVKGPASSLYGSEAIGGVINIITKMAGASPKFFLDYSSSSWSEWNGNMGFSKKINKKIYSLFNADGYYFNSPKDQDGDGFMDKTLQKRISIFNKWTIKQQFDRTASISLRYLNEDRHGGELGWNKSHRQFVEYLAYDGDLNSPTYNGDYVLPNGFTIYNQPYAKGFRVPRFARPEDKIAWLNAVKEAHPEALLADNMKYQESVFTRRVELISRYEFPMEEKITLQTSYNFHDQNSAYGTELFVAHQQTIFTQIYWDKIAGNHNFLMGAAYRYLQFTDNTIASDNGKIPFVTQMPGFFVQDLWTLSAKTSLLFGYRFDFDITRAASEKHVNPVHSPRMAFKFAPDSKNTIRISIGTGYRVVNIFSEDHRALSGQYTVRYGEALQPERSLSGTVNYEGRMATEAIGLTYDMSAYYTHFFNKIYPVRNDPNQTLTYFNVDGEEYARNFGASLDIALNFSSPFRLTTGVSFNQAALFEFPRDELGEQMSKDLVKYTFEFSPTWSGVFTAAYDYNPKITWDITGEWRGPMLLPTQGTLPTFDGNGNQKGTLTDPRSPYSPWFCKVNTQFTYKMNTGLQLYAGVKNLFNFVPKNLLVNTDDPFNDRSQPDKYGGLRFDTEYNYTQQQGITAYLGVRFSL